MFLREIHMRMLLDIVRQSLSTLWAHKQLATLGQNIMFMFPRRISAGEGSTQSGQTYYVYE
jgi:hypothetical protein